MSRDPYYDIARLNMELENLSERVKTLEDTNMNPKRNNPIWKAIQRLEEAVFGDGK